MQIGKPRAEDFLKEEVATLKSGTIDADRTRHVVALIGCSENTDSKVLLQAEESKVSKDACILSLHGFR